MPKMGRPPKPQSDATITRRLQIMLTPEQYAHVERQAQITGKTVAGYIRELIEQDRRGD